MPIDLHRVRGDRRAFMLSATLSTVALLSPGLRHSALAQSAPASHLSASYHGFRPHVTVGNMTGAAMDLAAYARLVVSAPFELLRAFGEAVAEVSGRVLRVASSDYMDFRYESAGREIGAATRAVAEDIAVDRSNTEMLSSAMQVDLERLVRMDRDPDADFLEMKELVRLLSAEVALLRAERSRADVGGSIYLVTETQLSRTGFDETRRLTQEIEALRKNLERMRRSSEALEETVLRLG